MKREIIVRIVLSCVVALIPMVAWGQGNDTIPLSVKILTPLRNFTEFVDVEFDPVTGTYNYGGFAIEVFRAVMNNRFPSIIYNFTTFSKTYNTMNGTFDNMLRKVNDDQDIDGAVGEISILSYRTELVDFTQPYLESSVSMLVRVKPQQTTKVAGFSLIRITYAFVITSFVFGFIAFVVAAIYAVVIVRARRVQGNDNRPKDTRLGSTIQTRLFTIIFFLILLTLIACYIISQTSSNATQSRSGTVESLDELLRNDANVGYREGSFVEKLLISKGFSESNLKTLKNEDEMVDMLSKGTSNGGIDAIVASGAHLKLLQAKYCDNFTLVSTTDLHDAGFGFAFKRGSRLGREVSNGILSIAESGELRKIQERTIGSLEDKCKDDPNIGSSFLGGDHRWILIVGGIIIGLLICISIVFTFLNSSLKLRWQS